MKALRMEFFKCRRRRLYLAPLLMITVQLLWGLANFRDLNAKDIQQAWINILYDFPLLNAMMTPVIAAVVASRVADIEHKGQTLKLLETIQHTGGLFDAKFACAACCMALTVSLQTATIVLFGLLRGFAGAPPVRELALYFLATLLVTLTILLVQLILSLLMSNQMVSMILGLVGAFIGLFSMFFPESLQKLLVWAYYGVLNVALMDWDPATRIVDYYFSPFDWGGLVCLCVMFVLLYALGRRLFVQREV